ncbi:TPA: outer membrane protein assembly factor BamD [Candidatus Poribacteria bacterium]|nr:outer membrane protein assembly factor BamD [Candidatus Poribacteria bacterium]
MTVFEVFMRLGFLLRQIVAFVLFLGICRYATGGEQEDYTFAYKLYNNKAYSVAQDQFDQFIRRYPRSDNADDARLLIAECALQLKNFDEAIQNYKQLLIDYPGTSLHLDALQGVAISWYRQGKYEEAIKGYEEVLEVAVEPEVISHSLYWIGESFDNLGLYQKAGEYYDQVISEYSQSKEMADALYSKGWTFYRLKNFRSAYELLSGFSRKYPNHYTAPEAGYRAAESLFKMGEWANAQIEFGDFIQTYMADPKRGQMITDARFRLGECYFQQRMMAEARQEFSLLLNEGIGSLILAEAQYWIAEILAEEKKATEAIYEYQKVIDLYPDSSVSDNARYGIGMVHFEQGEYAKALSPFKTVAVNLQSGLSHAARFRMGECFRMLREFNTAILNYKKILGFPSPYADDASYQIGICYFQLRDYQGVIGELNKLIEIYPETDLRPYALYHLGLAYFNSELYLESSQTFGLYFASVQDRNLETAPADEALFWKARALYEVEDYAGTIKACNLLIQKYPQSKHLLQSNYFIAESTYWQSPTKESYRSARQKYQELIKEEPHSEWAEKSQFSIGWTYFSEAAVSSDKERQKYYNRAIATWKTMIQKYPESGLADQALYQIGVSQCNLKKYSEAIQSFTRVIGSYASSSWQDNSQYQIGWSFYKLEKYSDAIDAFSEVIRKFPSSRLQPNAIFGVANCYFKQGRYTNAITEYNKVVENYPNLKVPAREAGAEKAVNLRPEAQYYIAESFMNLKNYSEAIKAFEKVIQHYPKSNWADDAQYSVATAHENLGQKEKSLQAYRILIKNYRSSSLAPDVQLQIGRFYYADKDYKRAISEFQKVIKQYPNTPSAWLAKYNIGKSYLMLGSYKQSIEAFSQVDPKSEFSASAMFEIGNAWYSKRNSRRNLTNAINILTDIPQKHPKSPFVARALLLAGECYQEMIQWQKAIDLYNRVLSYYPQSDQAEYAQISLGHSYKAQKNFLQAIEAYDVIRKKGTDRYRIEIVVDAELHLAETQAILGRHYDSGVTYLRVRHLREQHDSLTAFHAAVRAADAFIKADEIYMAKDTCEDALSLFEAKISTADAQKREEWDQLHEYAQNKYKQILSQIEQQ